MIKPTLWFLAIWNIILLAFAIVVVAAPGNGPENYSFEKVYFRPITYVYVPAVPLILSSSIH